MKIRKLKPLIKFSKHRRKWVVLIGIISDPDQNRKAMEYVNRLNGSLIR